MPGLANKVRYADKSADVMIGHNGEGRGVKMSGGSFLLCSQKSNVLMASYNGHPGFRGDSSGGVNVGNN